jgi:hypothetical protein
MALLLQRLLGSLEARKIQQQQGHNFLPSAVGVESWKPVVWMGESICRLATLKIDAIQEALSSQGADSTSEDVAWRGR